MMSTVLPAENGTMQRIALSFGHASAKAKRGSTGAAIAAPASVRKRRRWVRFMAFLRCLSAHGSFGGT